MPGIGRQSPSLLFGVPFRNSFFGIDILFYVNKYTFSVGDSTERTNKVRWCSNMGVVSCSIMVVLYVTVLSELHMV